MADPPKEVPIGGSENPTYPPQFQGVEDPWAAERYSQYGPGSNEGAGQQGLDGERYQYYGPGNNDGAGQGPENYGAYGGTAADGAAGQIPNEPLTYGDQKLMMLSPQDRQKCMTLWAKANGMDLNDQNCYTKLSQGPDGKSIAVGPFKLDAANIANNWLDGMVNSQGLVDRGALENYVRQGRLKPETAAAVSTPEFMQFLESMAAGKQPTPEQIQRFLPPDLQQCIAGDLVNASAAIVGMQGGALDTQNVVGTAQGFGAQAGPFQPFMPYGPGPGDTADGATGGTKYDTRTPDSAYDWPSYAKKWAMMQEEYSSNPEYQPRRRSEWDAQHNPNPDAGAAMPQDDPGAR